MPFVWTAEILAETPSEKIKILLENATKKGAHDLIALCEAELTKRMPPRKPKAISPEREGQYVSEFHFVCPKENEVRMDPSGTIHTGTWVVSEVHAEAALRYGAMVALHVARSEPSYRQGRIVSWKKQPRQPRNADGELVSHRTGIEFEIEPTSDPLSWQGNASAERGYKWSPIPSE